MPFVIPKRYVPALVKICRLSDAAAEELIQALESTTVTPDSDAMALRITEHVPSIPLDDLKLILDAVYSIYLVREFVEAGRNRFKRELFEAMRDSNDPELSVPASEAPFVKERFEKLLSIGALDTLSKAIRLQREGERPSVKRRSSRTYGLFSGLTFNPSLPAP